nr:RDD family protein [Paenibacillus massiliensis]
MEMKREAGFWIRLGAFALDMLIIVLPLSFGLGFFGGFMNGFVEGYTGTVIEESSGRDETIKNIVNLVYFLYALLLPVFWNGRTIGKRICGIRIAKYTTLESPNIGNMLLRVLVAGIAYVFTFGIGYIVSLFMVIFRQDKRSLHDMIAGTIVVRADVSYMDTPGSIDLHKYPSRF